MDNMWFVKNDLPSALTRGGRLRQLTPYWVKILPHLHMVSAETYPYFKCSISHVESQFWGKSVTFHWEIFVSYYPGIRRSYNSLLSNFRSIICQVLELTFKLLVLKVVAVAYEMWSLTRGSKYSNLNMELGILENWSLRRGGRLWEVVATAGLTVFINFQC